MDSHANDAERLWQKLSFQIIQWNSIYIDWNYKPIVPQILWKHKIFRKYPIPVWGSYIWMAAGD